MCMNCKNGGKPIAAVWWRVSTVGQLDLSPETQIRESRELAKSEGYEVHEDYIIGADWPSLNTMECPEMQTLLSSATNDTPGYDAAESQQLSATQPLLVADNDAVSSASRSDVADVADESRGKGGWDDNCNRCRTLKGLCAKHAQELAEVEV